MKVEILEFVDGAKNAKGVTVIIDVFRAFSVACYAFDAGASRVITTAEIDIAFKLASRYKNPVLAGERNEKKIKNFDFGNSPTEILRTDLTGKTLIHTTTAGTQGLANAVNAELLLTGSLVNAGAVANYIKKINPSHVSLVAMGYRANISAEEDVLCAEIIASKILGKAPVSASRITDLQHTAGKRFFDPSNIDFSPPSDFFLCTMIDRFDFVLKAVRSDENYIELFRSGS
ncbi:MAG TPA: 2-phosphosulfolactate phosphatase [Bacteroidales bacterium]|nr:2-phosphosulfolactate phosphatase [Bacteroidales bacterium]